ncbi:uncharacterized protein LOC143154189 [Ptiloglossa arizonensis]|uniref:uncharacterized protein LOC143154189 n=1 Tax=Ptiloglossa arizonensis TaxID=3350558 RepID=UPI003F9FCDE4
MRFHEGLKETPRSRQMRGVFLRGQVERKEEEIVTPSESFSSYYSCSEIYSRQFVEKTHSTVLTMVQTWEKIMEEYIFQMAASVFGKYRTNVRSVYLRFGIFDD